ncbi:MAG: hypothetical protein KA746_02760 [Pyrinomonadaceae bacterium]|nr:hypothetical protein [Pyrinomonadaceae bacterium]MBP6212961.1 hypothetical protein [Pyrinomonadaceae bacterium]
MYLLSVCAVTFTLISAVSAQPGGYQPADVDNAGVGLAADFAVKEQSTRSKTTITLTSVVKAEDGDAKLGARNLRLCLSVTAAGNPLVAQAVVHVDQYSNHKLMLWAKSTCGKSESGGGMGSGGGFKPDTDYKHVDNGDGGAGLAADFAVNAQAKKTKATITPATIIKAEDLEPALGARNFRLCLKTTVNGKATTAQTLVTVDQYSNHKLVSWTEMKCGESGGDDFKPVEKEFTAGVDMAADWAVGKHSKDTGIEHKLVEILKREEKGMFSMTYRICMKVGEGSETQVIQAVVSRDQYSNHKLVSWEHSNCTK